MSGPINVAGGDRAVENRVTVQKIIAAVNGGERLFLCSHHTAEGHRAFRGEEVSMLPHPLHTEAFARAITHLSRDGARRRTFQCDVQVNDFPVHGKIGRAHVELTSLLRTSYAIYCVKAQITT